MISSLEMVLDSVNKKSQWVKERVYEFLEMK